MGMKERGGDDVDGRSIEEGKGKQASGRMMRRQKLDMIISCSISNGFRCRCSHRKLDEKVTWRRISRMPHVRRSCFCPPEDMASIY